MGILWALIVGLVVGAIAKLLMPGKDPGGIIVTMLLGVAGSMVAFFIGRAFAGMHGRPQCRPCRWPVFCSLVPDPRRPSP